MKEQKPTLLDDAPMEIVELLPITVSKVSNKTTNLTNRRSIVNCRTINPFLERMYGKAL